MPVTAPSLLRMSQLLTTSSSCRAGVRVPGANRRISAGSSSPLASGRTASVIRRSPIHPRASPHLDRCPFISAKRRICCWS